MTPQNYHQQILQGLQGLQGLPPEALAEIQDFVYFVRKRILQPDEFSEELAALRFMSQQEMEHLEAEFANYQEEYPLWRPRWP